MLSVVIRMAFYCIMLNKDKFSVEMQIEFIYIVVTKCIYT